MKDKVKEVNQADGAHGYTEPQFERKHSLGTIEKSQGVMDRTIKTTDKVNAGGYVAVADISGLEAGRLRAKAVEDARRKSEAAFCAARTPHHSQNRSMDPAKNKKV